MVDETKTVEGLEGADLNGDGHISKEELDLHLEFKRKEMEARTQCETLKEIWLGLL